MDFSDLESIELQLARLSERGRKVAIDFVLTELTVGLKWCRQVRENPAMSDEKKLWRLTQAGLALQVAERSMWKMKLAHPEFDQMMALAERLRFELDDVRKSVGS
jgi:hypothetical protein